MTTITRDASIAHQSGQSITGWSTSLARIFKQFNVSEPVIHKSGVAEPEGTRNALWWRCSDGHFIYFGINTSDAETLLRLGQDAVETNSGSDAAQQNFKFLMDRSWGRAGTLVADPPSSAEAIETWDIQFVSGETLRIFAVAVPNVINGTSNLEMLLDIELPVMLRFGSRRMLMRDVAGLSSGSTVTLDRGIDDPVEVMINGRVIARGEAVTVGGAYGVRISAVSSRREQWLTSSFDTRDGGTGLTEE